MGVFMKRRFGFIKSNWVKDVLALAEMYDSKGEYVKACRCLWDCAIRGKDYGAIAILGYYYVFGLGCRRNYKRAFQLNRIAARHGVSEAMRALAISYFVGEGVKVNPKKAVKWYFKAAILGDALSQYDLGDRKSVV